MDALDQLFSRLTKSAKEALGYADALRKKRSLREAHVEHLLQGLYYAKKHGPTRTTFENLSISPDQLQKRLAASDLDSHPLLSKKPAAADGLPAFSEHARTALEFAQEVANAGGATKVKSRHILAGIFTLPNCEVPKAFPEVGPKVVDLVPELRLVSRRVARSDDRTDIFISYASEDLERIRSLAQVLEAHGWSVFWDRTIAAGKTWRQVIGEALDGARAVVVAWSNTSVESTWVQEEADRGREKGNLVPVLIDDVRPPLGFGALQALDLTDWDPTRPSPEFDKLIVDITVVLGPPPEGPKS